MRSPNLCVVSVLSVEAGFEQQRTRTEEMYGLGLSWWVIPLFLVLLLVYLCLCWKRGKRWEEEREERWEDMHPSTAGDQHPYGSNTLFAPPTSSFDWGQKEEQCNRIQLPPPYEAPPPYPSLPADQRPPRPIPRQGFSASSSNPPPVYTISSTSTSTSTLPAADGHEPPRREFPRQSFSTSPPFPPPPYTAVGQQKY